jgi:hypothetical protein
LWLTFSDRAASRWSAADLIARDTAMTRPLADPAYWPAPSSKPAHSPGPNGFELSASSLYRRLGEQEALLRPAA